MQSLRLLYVWARRGVWMDAGRARAAPFYVTATMRHRWVHAVCVGGRAGVRQAYLERRPVSARETAVFCRPFACAAAQLHAPASSAALLSPGVLPSQLLSPPCRMRVFLDAPMIGWLVAPIMRPFHTFDLMVRLLFTYTYATCHLHHRLLLSLGCAIIMQRRSSPMSRCDAMQHIVKYI